MIRKICVSVVSLALGFASGTAFAAKAKSADFTAADRTSRGLVLLSTSADETNWQAGTMLYLKRMVVKDGKSKLKHVDTFWLDNPTVTSHSATEHMNVHWRALEPGDYVLERTLVNPLACFNMFISYHFSVAAGDALYLGEIHLDKHVPVLRENYARDYAYFAANAKGEKPAAFAPTPPAVETKDNSSCQKGV